MSRVVKFSDAGLVATISCVRPGCTGPASLRVFIDDTNQWWCACEGCGLATMSYLNDNPKGDVSSVAALARWYGYESEGPIVFLAGEVEA